jgi:hypothetical protein
MVYSVRKAIYIKKQLILDSIKNDLNITLAEDDITIYGDNKMLFFNNRNITEIEDKRLRKYVSDTLFPMKFSPKKTKKELDAKKKSSETLYFSNRELYALQEISDIIRNLEFVNYVYCMYNHPDGKSVAFTHNIYFD